MFVFAPSKHSKDIRKSIKLVTRTSANNGSARRNWAKLAQQNASERSKKIINSIPNTKQNWFNYLPTMSWTNQQSWVHVHHSKSFATLPTYVHDHTCTTTKNTSQKNKTLCKNVKQVRLTRDTITSTNFTKNPHAKTLQTPLTSRKKPNMTTRATHDKTFVLPTKC